MCMQTVASEVVASVPVALPNRAPTRVVRTLTLAAHEVVRIVDCAGRPLLDILSGADGPVLQLTGSGTELDVAGRLRVQADAIEMIARDGECKLLAKDDVIVRGEKIRLN